MTSSIPSATVARLPRYLRCLSDMETNAAQCSSEQLASVSGCTAAQVRKDLSYLGSHGTRGVGYDIGQLMGQIRDVLGMNRSHPVVIVGAGNLGTALTNYKGFENWGFSIVAVLDIDEDKIGSPVDGLVVGSVNDLESIIDELGVEIGIITTPPSAAQAAADRMMAAGIKSILNLAPVVLRTPPDVSVRRVDLSTELGILAHHLSAAQLQKRDAEHAG
ncbi:redox-sensing transcriptional repressor Rex [Actinomycetota bacterium]|jgi:redox-sensing transcriptional repressor